MTAGQPYHPPKPFYGPLHRPESFQIDVQNTWDTLAEVALAAYPEPCPQLDHLALLLESHGVLVHRIPAPRPQSSPRLSIAATDPLLPAIFMNGTAAGANGIHSTTTAARPLSLFPQNAALVHGSRVIEVPHSHLHPYQRPRTSSRLSQEFDGHGSSDRRSALFNLLESANVEVIRWPVTSPSSGRFRVFEGRLVDIDETSEPADSEEEGSKFSPSDILVLSPTLLIARFSSRTNNKGLEYLWSVLSRPSRTALASQDRPADEMGAPDQVPTVTISKPPRPTTTLLVRITEPEASSLGVPSINPTGTHSPRSSLILQAPKPGPTPYTPLSRALVPVPGRVMLYDPALVAEGEARRLKSVLDRVQEGTSARGAGPSMSMHEMSDLFAARSANAKRDSVVSYGTFGSRGLSDEEGWQFISVEGLHTTSILLISPRLALVSLAPSYSGLSPTSAASPSQDVLTRVTQVLTSLGVRAVALPFSELNEKGGGVLDAVMVLRRETDVEGSEDEPVEAPSQDPWDESQGEGEGGHAPPAEAGCFTALTASIAAFFSGWWFQNSAGSDADGDGDGESSR